MMKSIAVYCGSGSGSEPVFEQQAYALGKMLAAEGIELIYGGAQIGLMGAVANGALENKGIVRGVIPTFLKSKEIAHYALTELITVSTMHERKLKMHELSDGIIALPGGFGTLEELFEMLTWTQLGLHQKPIGLLNTARFYTDLLHLLDNMVTKGFLKQINRDMLLVHESIPQLLDLMNNYKAPQVKKWIQPETT
jgi:uncharacterized protein (TIGR00730 family)